MRPIDAALEVLRSNGEPMHYRQIAEEAIALRLWETSAKEPATALAAALSVYVRDNPQGEIRRKGAGMYMSRPLSDRRRKSEALAAGRPLRGAPLLVGDCTIEHRVSHNWHADALGHPNEEDLPPITHDLQLNAPCWKAQRPFPHTCAGQSCEELVALARVQVNEFPLNWMTFYEDNPWFWAFDMCNAGPSEPLGAMLDEMIETGTLWEGLQPEEGSVFHLQGLEFNPHLRFEALGPDFLRAVLWLLSRSVYDVAIAETRAVSLSLPMLWGERADSSWKALTKDQLRIFATTLRGAGFTAHQPGIEEVVSDVVAQAIGISREEDGVSFYWIVREDERFDEPLAGAGDSALPSTLDVRDMPLVEAEDVGGAEIDADDQDENGFDDEGGDRDEVKAVADAGPDAESGPVAAVAPLRKSNSNGTGPHAANPESDTSAVRRPGRSRHEQ